MKKLTTETGAGQWGASLSFACSLFDMECEIFQVRLPPLAVCTTAAGLRAAVQQAGGAVSQFRSAGVPPQRQLALFCACAPPPSRSTDAPLLTSPLPIDPQVRASYDSKPYRRMLMELWGATCHPSPSNITQVCGQPGCTLCSA